MTINNMDLYYEDIKEALEDRRIVICHKHGYQSYLMTDGSIGCSLCARDNNKEGK